MTNQELIARLEGGETGREMDAHVGWLLDGHHTKFCPTPEILLSGMKDFGLAVPHYTTSLDAAKALADRVIENSDLIVHFMGNRVQATTDYDRRYYAEDVCDIWVYAPTGPAAICALALQHALLKAEG